MTNISDLLQRAVALHQSDRLAEAEPLYRHILCDKPDEPNALHLLGLVRSRAGFRDEGAMLIIRAIAVFPTFESYYVNLASLYRSIGDNLSAIDWYEAGMQRLPESVTLREMFCAMSQDVAVTATKTEDWANVIKWMQRFHAYLVGPYEINQRIYALLERQIQLALLTNQPEIALECLTVKNKVDFRDVPATDIDIFTVAMNPFPKWTAAAGLQTHLDTVEAQPAPEKLFDDYPNYLHTYIATLPELGRTPIGVTLGSKIEVVQGFYVKDNYECFILADRRDMLCEDEKNVIRSMTVPLVGVPPGAKHGAFRLCRPHYRRIEIISPVIFVPSTPNYWHFMVEVLPRIMLCDRYAETRGLPIILFDTRSYQYEMFELAGIDAQRVIDIRKTVDSPVAQINYHFHAASIPSPIPYPIAYRWLRETMLPKIRPGRGPLPRRVFLSRRGSYPKHRIANDTAVGDMLADYGFEVVLPESLTVLETIELIAQAEIVVAPIGAGTSNHVYLPPYGTWIHLNNPDFFHPESPWNSQMGTQATMVGTFRHLTGTFVGDQTTFPERLVDRLEIPIEIDLKALASLVEEAIARITRKPD